MNNILCSEILVMKKKIFELGARAKNVVWGFVRGQSTCMKPKCRGLMTDTSPCSFSFTTFRHIICHNFLISKFKSNDKLISTPNLKTLTLSLQIKHYP